MILHCPHCGEPVEIVEGEVRCGLCGYLLGLSPGRTAPHPYPGDPVPQRLPGLRLVADCRGVTTLAGLLYFW